MGATIAETLCIVFATLVLTRLSVDYVTDLYGRVYSALAYNAKRVRACMKLMYCPFRRVEKRDVFPSTEGFFMHPDSSGVLQAYYRFPAEYGGFLQRLERNGGYGLGGEYVPLWKEAVFNKVGCGESAIAGAAYERTVDQKLWKGTFKVNGETGVYDSMGLNIAGCAVITAHALLHKEAVVLTGGNTVNVGVRVETSRFLKPEKCYTGSAFDFAVAPLTANEWSAIGAKALSSKDFAPVMPGPIDMCFGQGVEGSLFVSKGQLEPQVTRAEKAGIIVASISTEPGASGSVYRRFVGGVPKYTGFHVSRPGERMSQLVGKYNIGIDFGVIFSFMRKNDLYFDTTYSVLRKLAGLSVGESFDYDFDKNCKEPLDYDEIERNYLDSEEMWQTTQDEITKMIYGDRYDPVDMHVGKRYGRRTRDQMPDEHWYGESCEPPVLTVAPGLKLDPVIESTDDDCFDDACSEPGTCDDVAVSSPSFAEDDELVQCSPKPLSSVIARAAICASAASAVALSLDFSDVKRQVLNSDFSFVGKLDEAVDKYGADAVHEYVVSTPAFATYRDYHNVTMFTETSSEETLPDMNGNTFFTKIGEYRIDGKRAPTTPERRKKPPKNLSDAAKAREAAVRELIKDLSYDGEDWVTPENSRKNILDSMRAHAGLACVESPPATEDDWNRALEKGMEVFDCSPIESHAERGFEGWYKQAATLQDSSSGVSARFRSLSKRQWVQDPQMFQVLIDLVQCRLVLMLIHSRFVQDYSPETVVKYGLKDVLEVTVKPESHKPEKAKLGRWRLIWICSVIDCLVQKLLHKAVNARDIENYQCGKTLHSAAGMGHHDEGIKQLCRTLKELFGDATELITCDASMWDFTMDKQAHINAAKRRVACCKSEPVARLIMTLGHVNYKHVCECKGDIWRCEKEGVNGSGQCSTTSDNTFSRVGQARASGADRVIANGDDMAADLGFDPEAAKAFGTRSRDVVVQDANLVPFTSHHINRTTCTASYDRPLKLAFNLLSNCRSEDFGMRVDALMYVVRNTPDALAKFKKHLGPHAKGTDTCCVEMLWGA
ncbi:hypothetical protein 1 [Beihai sobemo-like virus 3]|uniref:hypothetical protein 1 n=1 Tax=Beihai sobemo-like virus 3 TaxID=1922700 RepID=UPI00090AB808|nr:hypothetical protein 1 [Beihai sobemo-like virus 3]APG75708.1 hypothetical protein 1 [Beihai sobemo-like virus 3]